MGQIWAALKSLAVIAEFLKALLELGRGIIRDSANRKADETHASNAADIDAAFARPVMRVPDSGTTQPSAGVAGSPPVPGGSSGSPGVVKEGPRSGE